MKRKYPHCVVLGPAAIGLLAGSFAAAEGDQTTLDQRTTQQMGRGQQDMDNHSQDCRKQATPQQIFSEW